MKEVKLTARSITLTPTIKKYINEKLSKHNEILKDVINIEVEISLETTYNAKKKEYKLKTDAKMPQAFIKVEVKGEDLYALVDKAEVTLKRRLKRYNDLHKKWVKEEKWKLADIPQDIYDGDDYSDYEPHIAKTKTYEDDTPKHPAEAIEAMELMGYTAFLFRNIETDKYSMLYKRADGNYGLVEPPA